MLKTALTTSSVPTIIAAAGVAWAKHSGHCSMDDRMHHITERIGRKLDLDGDQQARLVYLGETLRSLRADRLDGRSLALEQVSQLLSAPSLDRDRAAKPIDQRIQPMNEQVRSVFDDFADFSDSLGPAQRSQRARLIGDRVNRGWGASRWAH